MEPTESVPCASVAPWAGAFPRLFEIYAASDRISPENWFQFPNVWRGLADEAEGLKPIEENLQALDAESWAVFRVKAARLVHLSDTWGYSRPLFDCLNETKGYRFLVSAGYQDVRFIPEQQGARTPDLRARSGTATVFTEVKTVNESVTQKDYFKIPGERRMARDVEYHLSPAFKNKLTSTIAVARTQLLAAQDQSVIRRIVYLVIRPDTNVETGQDLAAFLESQSTAGIEIVHHLLE